MGDREVKRDCEAERKPNAGYASIDDIINDQARWESLPGWSATDMGMGMPLRSIPVSRGTFPTRKAPLLLRPDSLTMFPVPTDGHGHAVRHGHGHGHAHF